MNEEDPRPGAARIEPLLADLQQRLDSLPDSLRHQRVFLATYRRITAAVGDAVRDGAFEDPAWVEEWDVSFVDFYLDALDRQVAGGEGVPAPWRRAFGAPPELPPLRHVLLGINAHVNFDMPQALLRIISDAQFDDAALMERRRRDHQRIDAVLAARVASESELLVGPAGMTALDRLLLPLNRLGSRRMLREARRKVWHNTQMLHLARALGPDALSARVAELEALADAKVAELLAPGQVLLRLAVRGFGVRLDPAAMPGP